MPRPVRIVFIGSGGRIVHEADVVPDLVAEAVVAHGAALLRHRECVLGASRWHQ